MGWGGSVTFILLFGAIWNDTEDLFRSTYDMHGVPHVFSDLFPGQLIHSLPSPSPTKRGCQILEQYEKAVSTYRSSRPDVPQHKTTLLSLPDILLVWKYDVLSYRMCEI